MANKAGPNERRTISREDLGFYNALVIAGVYEVTHKDLGVEDVRSFIQPLEHCIQEHAFLSVVVKNKNTEKPFFERVSSLNLSNHIAIIHDKDITIETENESIEQFLQPILDRPWPADIPPWRIMVLPLPSQDEHAKRVFIAFSFSHTLGDGMVGHTFHRTFLNSWQRAPPANEIGNACLIVPSSELELPLPFDTPKRLPISWTYLLSPLLAVYLPKWICGLLGLRAAVTTVNAGTGVRLLEIDAPTLQNALTVSRAHGTKLTGLLHQMIIRALSKALPDANITNFVSGTAVDMRSSIGLPGSSWGLYVTGHYEVHPRHHPSAPGKESASGPAFSDGTWASAAAITGSLASCATRLHDQAIGLLRYVPSIRAWTAGKIGQQRDCSYEVSNLLAFDGGLVAGVDAKCKITKMVFATPANVVSGPLVFNVVSVTGGSLVIAVNWQIGALGLPVEKERAFVDEVCEFIKADFGRLRMEVI
ncbi:uncharacterized protein DSM5745_02512 [Aspergillus mulundensis]|uniref:Alcohol acetyltransferase n=1 Tax=Aspergillus mulundensis TaxID=1810919 RepID=A0A3D8SWP0_9EURO|nr:Uncharacterized protein DSM5745_02512 [Aspergillus mulundensis]RDW90737.1 Uncharacterized protein DSM5745_02512 [Aspergillus mulundensis]